MRPPHDCIVKHWIPSKARGFVEIVERTLQSHQFRTASPAMPGNSQSDTGCNSRLLPSILNCAESCWQLLGCGVGLTSRSVEKVSALCSQPDNFQARSGEMISVSFYPPPSVHQAQAAPACKVGAASWARAWGPRVSKRPIDCALCFSVYPPGA